ncbi:MAG: hypothetical protein ABJB98_08085 [Actinomycetota bacterium]
MAELHTFGPITHGATAGFTRADLEFYGINHFRPSFIARIFFNDPAVTIDSASADRASYAGQFAIFGHQRCSGDEGHCEVHVDARRFDERPSHPLTRAFKRVLVTDALRRYIDTPELTITIVVTCDPAEVSDAQLPLLDLHGMQLTTFA